MMSNERTTRGSALAMASHAYQAISQHALSGSDLPRILGERLEFYLDGVAEGAFCGLVPARLRLQPTQASQRARVLWVILTERGAINRQYLPEHLLGGIVLTQSP
jgi:hypothetical protein